MPRYRNDADPNCRVPRIEQSAAYAASSTPWIYEFLFGGLIPVHVPREPAIALQTLEQRRDGLVALPDNGPDDEVVAQVVATDQDVVRPEIWSKSPINAAIRSARCANFVSSRARSGLRARRS